MTIEEFWPRYRMQPWAELVRGEVVEPPREAPVFISQVALNAERLLGEFVVRQQAEWLFLGAHICTGPNTIRVAEAALWDIAKVPTTDSILTTTPKLVLEVRLATDPWLDRFKRMVQYLKAEVAVVLMVDTVTASISVYRPDNRPYIFERGDMLTMPDVLPGFEVPVARFFEE